MIPFTWLFVAILFILGIFFIAFLIWGLKRAFSLLVNSLIGFFALWITQQLLLPSLAIKLWKIIVVAIFGIFGYVFVIITHLLF